MPRRTKGEGSVRKRSNGLYEFRFLMDGVYKSAYGKTPEEARNGKERYLAKLAKKEADAEEQKRMALEQEYVSYLYKWSQRPNITKVSKDNYASRIRNCIAPVIGSLKLTEVTPETITEIYSWNMERGLSMNTLVFIKAILTTSLRDALWDELIDSTPMAKVRWHPSRFRPKPNPLKLHHQAKLIETETDPQSRNVWTLAIDTGLRRGELFGLKWADIDLDNIEVVRGKQVKSPVINVVRQYSHALREFKEPKRGSSREVKASPSVIEALERQQVIQTEKQLKSRRWVDNGLVFSNSVGEPVNGDKVGEYLTERLKELKIQHRRFHDLRSTFTQNCHDQGVGINTIQKWMGHADIKTTLESYSKSTPEMEVDGANKMAQLRRKVS